MVTGQQEKPRDNNSKSLSDEWGDYSLSPKGDEKEILRGVVLPNIVHRIQSQGGLVRTLLDIGADTGYITSLIRKPPNGDQIQATGIEINLEREGILRRQYNEVFLGPWIAWHVAHSDNIFDLIISSHNLYYFSDPLKMIDEMSEHLSQQTIESMQSGRICLILEDFDSGKLKLLQRIGVVSPDTFMATQNGVSIINPARLTERLNEKFDVETSVIPVNVKFNSVDEALERFRGFFAGSFITPRTINDCVENEIVKGGDGTCTWRRDSVAILLKNK